MVDLVGKTSFIVSIKNWGSNKCDDVKFLDFGNTLSLTFHRIITCFEDYFRYINNSIILFINLLRVILMFDHERRSLDDLRDIKILPFRSDRDLRCFTS